MIALIMRAAGLHPSFLVGSELNEVGTNAGLDSGEWLIVEADESDGTFLRLALDAAIVTNIEEDHLWYWGDMRPARATRSDRFVDAVDGPGGPVRRRSQHPAPRRGPARRRSRTAGPTTPGTAPRATRAVAAAARSCSSATVSCSDRSGCRSSAGTTPRTRPGAAAMTLELGASFEAVQNALAGFGGVARRFQHRGELDGVTIDRRLRAPAARDPGHHPRGRRGRLGPGHRGVPAVPLRAHRAHVAGVRRRVRRGRPGHPHRRLRLPRAAHPRA